ncbi:MAG: DUF3568 family protein [Planctomycetota bacterium]
MVKFQTLNPKSQSINFTSKNQSLFRVGFLKHLRLLCASVMLLTLFLGGCVAKWMAGGETPIVGVYRYDEQKFELQRNYPVDMQKAWLAVVDMTEKLQFSIGSSSRDPLSAIMNTKKSDGTPIRIAFEYITDNITAVKIKVGVYGEKDISYKIHDQLKRSLDDASKK